jgi:hypothetical protein
MPISAPNIGLGVGQTWQNVTAGRAAATTYTNATASPIMVSVNINYVGPSSQLTITVNGSVVAAGSAYCNASPGGGCSVVVPPGGTYSVTLNATTINSWWELR